MSDESDIEYLKRLTLEITGDDDFSEKASVRDYVDNIVSYFTNILHSLPNNVYWLDKNCILRGGNDNLARQLNLRSGFDLVGLTYEQMARGAKLPTKELEAFHITELEVIRTGIPSIDKEEPPIQVAGKTFYYLSNKMPLRNKKGDVIGIIGISTDITKFKEMQFALNAALQKAEVANQAKTEFLENMRHDIRTPLTGILGCSLLIQRQPDNPEKVKGYAEGLVQSSEALLKFLNKVLESIQAASGEIPLLKRKFNLRAMLEEIIQLNRSQALLKQLELILDYDESIPPYLIGDPMRVQRIILELVVNALKFTEKGEVKISVRAKEMKKRQLIIEFKISDTGIGIPPDKQQEVYTRFKRLTPAYQGRYAGSGLGLSIVKQFVDDLDGELYLESKPQKGSTFICFISFKKSMLSDVEVEA